MFGNIFQVYQRFKTNFLVNIFILAEYRPGKERLWKGRTVVEGRV